MTGWTWARLAALTAVFTVIVTNMVGCAPSEGSRKTPSGLTVDQATAIAWDRVTVDDRFAVCTGYRTQPKVIVDALVAETHEDGATAGTWSKFLDGKCSK